MASKGDTAGGNLPGWEASAMSSFPQMFEAHGTQAAPVGTSQISGEMVHQEEKLWVRAEMCRKDSAARSPPGEALTGQSHLRQGLAGSHPSAETWKVSLLLAGVSNARSVSVASCGPGGKDARRPL